MENLATVIKRVVTKVISEKQDDLGWLEGNSCLEILSESEWKTFVEQATKSRGWRTAFDKWTGNEERDEEHNSKYFELWALVDLVNSKIEEVKPWSV